MSISQSLLFPLVAVSAKLDFGKTPDALYPQALSDLKPSPRSQFKIVIPPVSPIVRSTSNTYYPLHLLSFVYRSC